MPLLSLFTALGSLDPYALQLHIDWSAAMLGSSASGVDVVMLGIAENEQC